MISTKEEEWFGQWFDSPYYHILYQHRDYEEARHFIDVLGAALLFSKGDRVMDLACGKGRHSIYLNSKGLSVVGLDLSEQNINFARKYENEKLQFFVHDMRKVFQIESFDFVINLFTSFGYFEEEENQIAISAAADALKKGGHFLLDFLNPYVVINNLVQEEVKTIGSIEFHLSREFSEGYIIKKISFRDNKVDHHFQEKVNAITQDRFLEYFRNSGLSVQQTWGDYQLKPFNPKSSERMIFLLKKE